MPCVEIMATQCIPYYFEHLFRCRKNNFLEAFSHCALLLLGVWIAYFLSQISVQSVDLNFPIVTPTHVCTAEGLSLCARGLLPHVRMPAASCKTCCTAVQQVSHVRIDPQDILQIMCNKDVLYKYCYPEVRSSGDVQHHLQYDPKLYKEFSLSLMISYL